MTRIVFGLILLAASALWAENWLPDADLYFLGEAHDNAAHHEQQADLIRQIDPSAIVFEMVPDGVRLSPGQEAETESLRKKLNWWGRDAEDFALYAPVLREAQARALYGALIDRPAARAAMKSGVEEAFGEGADLYGLTAPLDQAEQDAREAMQQEAHCGAMPEEMLPVLVALQRLRDAALARAAIAALRDTGGPVVVITGNGHARKDWGAPQFVARVAPELRVYALGQGEGGAPPQGLFDETRDNAMTPERPDSCAAFRQD